jgi:hypothetical protein
MGSARVQRIHARAPIVTVVVVVEEQVEGWWIGDVRRLTVQIYI